MIPDYQQPILKIHLPGDGKALTSKVKDETSAPVTTSVRRRTGTPAAVKIVGQKPSVVALGATWQFQAATFNLTDTRVTWSIVSGAGSVDDQGRYTAPEELPEVTVVVIRVTSVSNPDLWDEHSFDLSASLAQIQVRVKAECCLAPIANVANTASFLIGNTPHELTLPEIETGGEVTVTFDQVDVELVHSVRVHLVFDPPCRFNGLAEADFDAVQLSPTLYEVDLCADDPTWTYFNDTQSYTATCESGSGGAPVTRASEAGEFSSLVSPADANAQALAAAQAAAEEDLVCTPIGLQMYAEALNAEGRIRITVTVPDWYGTVEWYVTLGEGNRIQYSAEGDDYLAEDLHFTTTPAEPLDAPLGYRTGYDTSYAVEFYFSELDPRWLIGNDDGDTWLIDVAVTAVLTDPDPELELAQRWRKYLLI